MSEPELIEAFKDAALSVTKLYKKSAATQAKARTEGYNDCLEDLLAFLDKEALGTGNGDASKIRKWALERIDGRDAIIQNTESEDEADKAEALSPQAHRASSAPQSSAIQSEVNMRDSAPQAVSFVPAGNTSGSVAEEPEITVPTLETFTFQSPMPYPTEIPHPQDASMGLANLDISDSQAHQHASNWSTVSSTAQRITRPRNTRVGTRTSSGRTTGKRKFTLDEIFDIGSLGHGRDVFGTPGKRSRLG
ncbi:hypothetical protein QBC47DRAFT_87488 [Echria macrotheca]|uniref:Uncharacterized protein n=1 Tax=Echria macrotheca TaxID=438768 RepID=A0AAJ0F275_9PEZI|nr:hypothetical protein QBC47DRAFT_87488 [Echria macrotheca]